MKFLTDEEKKLITDILNNEEYIYPYPEFVKQPHWITHNKDNPFEIYGECSECGFEQTISDRLNYCPNCGVRMNNE